MVNHIFPTERICTINDLFVQHVWRVCLLLIIMKLANIFTLLHIVVVSL
jgi:hypothetical protein